MTSSPVQADRDAEFLALHARAMRDQSVTVVDLLDRLPAYRPRSNWSAWRAFLGAAFGLSLTPAELAIYRACTGREDPPRGQVSEVWVPVGRRGGKGRIAAVIAAYLAAYRDYTGILAAGQTATLPVIAADMDQAREVMGYLDGIFGEWPLSLLVQSRTTTELRLLTRVNIEVRAASYRTVRAPTIVGAVLDEIAFWRSDNSLNPDEEILRALRPGMLTVPGSMLVALSSPYARRGVLWDAYERHYGRDSAKVLVWKAPTLTMHPDSGEVAAKIAEAYEADHVSASAEYGAEFRTDVAALLPVEVVRACITDAGRTERAPEPRWRYVAFVDPSGGTSDAFTLSIGHWHPEVGKVYQDFLGVWSDWETQGPHAVVQEACDVLRRYRVKYVTGDRYAGEWPAERFREGAHQIECSRRDDEAAACDCKDVWKVAYVTCEDSKSDLYRECVPAFNDRRLELLDHPRMVTEFVGLDRRVARGGHESIDHRPGAHDDAANATAGMIVRVLREKRMPRTLTPAVTVPELHTQRLHGSLKKRLSAFMDQGKTYRGGKGAAGI